MENKEEKGSQSNPDFLKSIALDQEIYNYSEVEYNKLLNDKPWNKDPHYFKKVKISALALVKMVIHANIGGQIEVMGMLQGKADKDSFIIFDCFALPVQGTETRVNAGAEANEYIGQYLIDCDQVNKKENLCGWYHSHPSYGCWLSGIDVNTQALYQNQDPWVALVIDPIRTMTKGTVEIGAFRTYPTNYSPPGEVSVEEQMIPLEKIEDFGVHYKRYYSLEISYFKNSKDLEIIDVLWNKYWVSNLTQNSLFSNKKYFSDGICDLAKKAEKHTKTLRREKILSYGDMIKKEGNKQQQTISSSTKDFMKYSIERSQAFFNEGLKNILFSTDI